MFEDKTTDTIHSNMLINISDEYDKQEGSFIYDSTKPAAIEIEQVYKDMDSIADKIDVDNLSGEELETFVYQRTGLVRKQATYATTTVTVTGSEGALINIGDKVSSDTINYLFTESKTIDSSGVVNVLVQCENSGSSGNVPAGAINKFPISLAGLTSIINNEAVTNGYDAETDNSLRQRYYEKLQNAATSGNKAHYKIWAKEVTGVGDARVFPLWNGNNTVKVVIIDSNKQSASTDLVEEVQNHIDPGITGLGDGEAPIGAFCTVVSATGKSINLSFTVIKLSGYTDEQIITNVSSKITDYLKEIAFVEDYVSYAKIGSLVLESEGVEDYSNLTINGLTSNISITDEEVAILGGVSIV